MKAYINVLEWHSQSTDQNPRQNQQQDWKIHVHRCFLSNLTDLQLFTKGEYKTINHFSFHFMMTCSSLLLYHIKSLKLIQVCEFNMMKFEVQGVLMFILCTLTRDPLSLITSHQMLVIETLYVGGCKITGVNNNYKQFPMKGDSSNLSLINK